MLSLIFAISSLDKNGNISSSSGVMKFPFESILDLSFGQNSCSVSIISSINAGSLILSISDNFSSDLYDEIL